MPEDVARSGYAWNSLKKIMSKYFPEKKFWAIFLTFTLFFAVFFVMYFSVVTLASGDDHYFHIRFAEQLRLHGFLESFRNFHSIYLSKVSFGNQYFVYYNFLFYLVLIPFTYFDPLYIGIKFYAVSAAALAFTLLYWCLRRFGIRYPFAWIILVIAVTNVGSIWRFFLSRPYTLAPTLLLVLLVFLYQKRYFAVAAISFIYLFWHSATFYMPLGVALTYFMIEWFYGEKPDFKTIAASAAGTGLAVAATYLFSSGFFLFIYDLMFGAYWDTILGKKVPISEGVELYPKDFFVFIQANALIFAAFVTAVAVDVCTYVALKLSKVSRDEYFMGLPKGRRHVQTAVFVLTLLFFLGTVVASGRFGDFFTMFAGLYVALSFDYIFKFVDLSGPAMMRRGIITGFIVVLVYLFASNMLFLQRQIASGSHPAEMYIVGNWLKNNTKPGDVIFEANWSWFPQLYYHSPDDYYITGSEPRFLYTYSPRLYWLLSHMTEDAYVCDKQVCPGMDEKVQQAFNTQTASKVWAKEEGDLIAATILKDFNSHIIVTAHDYRYFNYVIDHNDHFIRRLYDAQRGFWIYEIKR